MSNFPTRKSLDVFPFIGCNSMITSNKQRQEHNNLATIRRQKFKGAYERSKSLQFIKHGTKMQTLTRMDKVVINDYYHMTTLDEIMNLMTLTHLLLDLFLTLGAFVL